jgi:hypothetical protein
MLCLRRLRCLRWTVLLPVLPVLPVLAVGQDYGWDRLHRCTTPLELISTVAEFIEFFPCRECRDHFSELVDQHPFPLEHVHSETDVRLWSWLSHNIVNLRLGKPWYPLAMADVT